MDRLARRRCLACRWFGPIYGDCMRKNSAALVIGSEIAGMELVATLTHAGVTNCEVACTT